MLNSKKNCIKIRSSHISMSHPHGPNPDNIIKNTIGSVTWSQSNLQESENTYKHQIGDAYISKMQNEKIKMGLPKYKKNGNIQGLG